MFLELKVPTIRPHALCFPKILLVPIVWYGLGMRDSQKYGVSVNISRKPPISVTFLSVGMAFYMGLHRNNGLGCLDST